jgi:16S rRNA G966 N2-methylase RsmD
MPSEPIKMESAARRPCYSLGSRQSVIIPVMNRLYFGDNLAWLRHRNEFPDASVDLVYLDPPFNSNADNCLK